MKRHEFHTEHPPRLSVRIPEGYVEVTTAEAGETVVEVEAMRGDPEEVLVEQRGDEIVVDARRRVVGFGFLRSEEYAVRITAPHGAKLDAETASADVRVRGVLADLQVKCASGDVEAGTVDGEARVRSASGDVSIGLVGGRVEVNTASGEVEVGHAGGDVAVRSASGDVRIDEASAGVSVQTASGDVEVGSVIQGSADVKSASGDVRVGIKQGSRLWVDARSMSGETTSELEVLPAETSTDGPLVELRAQTMSGDIRIVRA